MSQFGSLVKYALLACVALAGLGSRVDAAAPGRLPTIYAFNHTGAATINRGESLWLNWSVGDATEVSVSPDIGVVRENYVQVTPQTTMTYVLTAKNANGTVTKSRTITVVAPPVIGSFTATPETLVAGQAAQLNWSAPGATWYRVTSSTGAAPGQLIGITSATVRPQVTTTYTLVANNSAGSSAPQTVTIPVTAPVPKPTITSFTASPASVPNGSPTTLTWAVNGATSLSISPRVGVVTGNSVTFSPTATTTYTLTATNESGSVTKKTNVTVTTPPPPTISAFTASPHVITAGTSSTLAWTVSSGATMEISANTGASPGVVTGTSVNVTPSVTTIYTLRATNLGGSVTRTVSVTVNAPAPTITAFTANPPEISRGESTTLNWSVTGATQLSISPGIGAVSGSSVTVTPTVGTTYTLTASNGSGSVTRNVSVNVTVPPPEIAAFVATPAAILVGESTTLNWSVSGANSLSISPAIGAVTGTSVSVTPATSTNYVLTATNDGGSVTRSVAVTVNTPEPLPTIGAFEAEPTSIAPGGSSNLTWSVSGAASLSIAANIGASPGVVTGSNVAVTPTASTTYTLTATNSSGGSVTRTVNVAVVSPPAVINSFTATPSSIAVGASSTLEWSVSGAATLFVSADISANPGAVTGTSLSVTPTATTVYTLTATNATGDSVSSTVTISVTAAPPAPTIEIRSFTASDDLIQAGEEVTLTWETVNAQSLWLSASYGGDVGDMRGRTSVVVRPMATTRYVLNAYHSTYGSKSAAVTVNVGPAPVPVVNAFNASPSTISIGNSTTLSWSVDGANEISITADEGTSPGVVTGSSITVSPTDDTIYTLRARNPYGEVTREAAVIVTGPTAPVIGSFTANPAFIQSGASSTLVWSVSGADSVSITASVGQSPGAVTGTSVEVSPTATTTYTLTATNPIGSTTATAQVTFYTPGNGSVAHPRVWITPARVAQLAQRAAANDPAWITLRNACEQWAAMPVRWPDESPATGYIHGGYQYFDYMRPVVELALGYQVTKDFEPQRAVRYATKAREILIKMSDPVRHGRESTDSGWSIRAYVPALALGYDWLYETLSDSDRAQIYTEINRWTEWFDTSGLGRDFPNGNYFAGYYAAKALGALATEGENPKADAMWNDWLNRIHYGMVQPYHAQWLSGGGAPDGWNYGKLETINMLRPAAAAFTAKGLDLVSGTRPFTWANGHAHWVAHFTQPDMKSMSDRGFLYPSSNPSGVSAAWATQYTGLMRMVNASNTPLMQQYLLDLRAQPGRENAEPWVEFLFFDANASGANYRTALSYRTPGDGQVSMRSSWQNDAVWATFQSGPYTGAPVSSEEFYDKGALVIHRGNVQFVVNAWGAMFRHTPGTEDGELRMDPTPQNPRGLTPFDQLYTEMFGVQTDGVTGGRRLFNTFYAFRNVSHPPIPGYYGQTANGPGVANTTLSRFEEGNRYVLMRGTKLEEMYFTRYPINGWERSVLYVRPQLFFVYDRTAMVSAAIDNWMSWHVAAAPTEQLGFAGTHRFDVVDTRAAFGGNLFRGRVTTVLPANHVVTSENLFNRGKVYRLNVRAAAPALTTSWLTVFDASASAESAGLVDSLSAANGGVLNGDVEGAIVVSTTAANTVATFSRSASAVSGAVRLQVPARNTTFIINDLVPGAAYSILTNRSEDTIIVQIAPGGGTQLATAQGVLSFDVSVTTN